MLVYVLDIGVLAYKNNGEQGVAGITKVMPSVHAATELLDRFIEHCDVVDYEVRAVEIP